MLNKKQLDVIYELVYTEKNDTEIMAELGVASSTFYRWNRDPEFQKELDKEQNKYLKKLAQKAVRKLNSLMNSDKENIAYQSAKALMDKGIETVQKQEVTVNSDSGINIVINYSEGENDKS